MYLSNYILKKRKETDQTLPRPKIQRNKLNYNEIKAIRDRLCNNKLSKQAVGTFEYKAK